MPVFLCPFGGQNLKVAFRLILSDSSFGFEGG